MDEVLQQHPKVLHRMQHILCCVLAPLPGDWQHLGVQANFLQAKGISNPKANPVPHRASSPAWPLALPMVSAP